MRIFNTILIKIIKKIKSFYIIICLCYYRKLFLKECKKCCDDIRIYFPISIHGLQYMSFGKNFKLDYGSIIEAWDLHNGFRYKPELTIGSNVSFGKNCHIGCINKIIIDDNVLVGSNVLIIDHNHGLKDYSDIIISPNNRQLSSRGPIHIEENVWVGEKVSILSGVTIGKCSIIGANSVVTKNIPAYCIACGVPAKIIKRFIGEN